MPLVPLRVVYPMRFAKAPLRGLKPLVLVEETVEFEVREIASAPLAVKASVNDRDIEWRAFEGRHWACSTLPDVHGPEVMVPLDAMLAQANENEAVGVALARQGAYPRAEVLSRGVTVLEDGREEKLARVAEGISRLLVIGGAAHREEPLPEWHVGVQYIAAMSAHRIFFHTCLTHSDDAPCGRFPHDRLDEALAFSKVLWERFEGNPNRTAMPIQHDEVGLEYHVEGSFPAPSATVLETWKEMYHAFSAVPLDRLGTDLVRLLARGLDAAAELRENPGDEAWLEALERSMASIADREDGFHLGQHHASTKDIMLAYRTYRRMTEGLDADDVAALTI